MHPSDERPPTSGRPSLLSAEQQAEADRRKRLNGPDAKAGAAQAGGAAPGRPKAAWAVAASVVVVAACAAAVFSMNGSVEPDTVAAVPAPASLPAAAASVPAPEADEVSTAAILEEPPAVTGRDAPRLQAAADELTELLASHPAKPAVAPQRAVHPPQDKPQVKPAPARLAQHKPSQQKPSQQKPAQQKLARQQHAAELAAARRRSAAPPPAPAVDSDVALLAALVAHSKARQAPVPPAALKLKQCKTLGSVAEADQCRARLCSGSAKNEAECKTPGSAKVATAT